tara:strand:+ start:321 stop:668 length:348 start_codon:yes stop_codon:yes gene_type:complete
LEEGSPASKTSKEKIFSNRRYANVVNREIEMKKLIEQVDGEGLEALLGEQVTFFCMNYIYAGKLIGMNETCVLLQDPKIVYETGSFHEKQWEDAQPVCPQLYIQTASIESFGVVK